MEKEEAVLIKERECAPGKKIGRLTLVSRSRVKTKSYGNRWLWHCKCDCGRFRDVLTFQLGTYKHGKYYCSGVTDCGKHTKEKLSKIAHKGKKPISLLSDSSERSKWRSLYLKFIDMHKRCENPKCKNYKNYGGRGICVCSKWNTFEPFKKWAIKQGYDPLIRDRKQQTLDRIDVNGNYEPDNCRFTTSHVQNMNKRNNVFLDINDKKISFHRLSKLLNTNETYLRNQYYHNEKYQLNNEIFYEEVQMKLNTKKEAD